MCVCVLVVLCAAGRCHFDVILLKGFHARELTRVEYLSVTTHKSLHPVLSIQVLIHHYFPSLLSSRYQNVFLSFISYMSLFHSYIPWIFMLTHFSLSSLLIVGFLLFSLLIGFCSLEISHSNYSRPLLLA